MIRLNKLLETSLYSRKNISMDSIFLESIKSCISFEYPKYSIENGDIKIDLKKKGSDYEVYIEKSTIDNIGIMIDIEKWSKKGLPKNLFLDSDIEYALKTNKNIEGFNFNSYPGKSNYGIRLFYDGLSGVKFKNCKFGGPDNYLFYINDTLNREYWNTNPEFFGFVEWDKLSGKPKTSKYYISSLSKIIKNLLISNNNKFLKNSEPYFDLLIMVDSEVLENRNEDNIKYFLYEKISQELGTDKYEKNIEFNIEEN